MDIIDSSGINGVLEHIVKGVLDDQRWRILSIKKAPYTAHEEYDLTVMFKQQTIETYSRQLHIRISELAIHREEIELE
jgi:hypothetical protein